MHVCVCVAVRRPRVQFRHTTARWRRKPEVTSQDVHPGAQIGEAHKYLHPPASQISLPSSTEFTLNLECSALDLSSVQGQYQAGWAWSRTGFWFYTRWAELTLWDVIFSLQHVHLTYSSVHINIHLGNWASLRRCFDGAWQLRVKKHCKGFIRKKEGGKTWKPSCKG